MRPELRCITRLVITFFYQYAETQLPYRVRDCSMLAHLVLVTGMYFCTFDMQCDRSKEPGDGA